MELKENPPAPVINLEDIEFPPEIVEMYEEAFKMPSRTIPEIDKRKEHLEITDSLARELVSDAVIALIRNQAFINVEDAKRRQETRLGLDSDPSTQRTDLPPESSTQKKHEKMTDLRTEQVMRALARLGCKEIEGGKGSHHKVYYDETGKTTTIPEKIGPTLLKTILKQLGITWKQLKEAL